MAADTAPPATVGPDHGPAHPPAKPVGEVPTPPSDSTRRGMATASFALGFWATLTFWWYPFGLAVAVVGLALGLLSVARKVPGGRDGEPLAWVGLFFSATAAGLAVASYRFVQLVFEENIPTSHSILPFWN